MIDLIAFDADDTLWHNETLYASVQKQFQDLLAPYGSPQEVEAALYRTEMANLAEFGYGIKSFTLSMIETAVQMSGGSIPAHDLLKIVDYAKTMIRAEVQLLEGVTDTIAQLARHYDLMLVTKGDLLDQERKLSRSGLLEHFKHIEIVSDKTPERYAALLVRHSLAPERFLMVGNSLRSDILPVIAIGGQAVFIPYHLTWAHESEVEPHLMNDGYWELEHISQLPELLERLRENDL
jgi:putative hydrolase of the HAD superfamily